MSKMNVAEFAQAIGAPDTRIARKYLRAITPIESRAGKGGRWAIDASKAQIAAHAKAFDAFIESRKPKALRKAQGDDE